MSAIKMKSVRVISAYQESAIQWPEDEIAASLLSVYPIFLALASLLAVFFAISLVLAFTTQYFLDWGSALMGFLGTAGLSAVAWFSKREIE